MKTRALFFPILLFTAANASAQLLSFGVKGGVPITDQIKYRADESRPYIIGPSVEVRLPGHFAVEASALYQRLGSSSSFNFNQRSIFFNGGGPLQSSTNNTRERANSWEFPLLGKYYFRSHRDKWQPYVGTGYAFQIAHYDVDSHTVNTDSSGTVSAFASHYEYNRGLNIGATAAAGVRFRAGRFAVLPEFRYTRWGGKDDFQIPRNDVKFLMGINF